MPTPLAGVLMALAIAAPAWADGPPPAGAGQGASKAGASKNAPATAAQAADTATAKPPEQPVEHAAHTPSDGEAAAQAPVTTRDDDPDRDVNAAQPDFALSALPTTLRVPRNRLVFRLTHRFNQPLDQSGIRDLWGMDSGAIMGFELRYGLVPGGQIGFYRTSDRTIEFFSQYNVLNQGPRSPVGVALFGSIEGTDNFTGTYAPGIGAVVSRELGTRAAVYAHPFWVNNTNPGPPAPAGDNSTTMLGLGVRVRVFSATYVVAEAAPRLSGYAPGASHVSFGIEQRAGGHLFQITFANNQGTTPANVARGGPGGGKWYLGFNLVRKFF